MVTIGILCNFATVQKVLTMKKLYKISSKLFAIGVMALAGMQPLFAATDSEGYPIVYLRGSHTDAVWEIDEAYRFNRDGDLYYLEITSQNPVKDSQFKIGDEDWRGFDYGGATTDIYVEDEGTLSLVRSGKNLKSRGFDKCMISFYYTSSDARNLTVTFDFDGNIPEPPKMTSGTLPVMYINVYTDETHSKFDNEVIDYNLAHKDYFTEAEYWLDVTDCPWMTEWGAESVGSKEKPLKLNIKARGNWTRIGFSKKPFKLKLDKKQNLLGLTPEKSKHYALLAHADDNYGYLRNFTTFNLGERIGLPWTPAMQPIELVVNGDYRGLYFLTESIRIGDGRIDIQELGDKEVNSDLISGGYLVELDNYDEDNQIRMEEKSAVGGQHLDMLRITWDTPEQYSDIQKRFVTEQFEAMNNAIGNNDNVIWSYLDLDDAARYYIVREITSDTEAYHGSTYLFRDRGHGKKWHFSPLWDAGNAFNGRENEFFYDCDPFGNTWIPSLRVNGMFNDKVRETWLWFMQNEYDGIEEDLQEYVDHLKGAVDKDHDRWKGVNPPQGGQPVADNRDMDGKFDAVKSKLRSKINWLKGQFGDYTAGLFEEPERDLTEAAPLPDYVTTGIVDIFTGKVDETTEFYNLQGVRVQHPKRGEIYIIRQGDKSYKAIF